MNIQFLHLPNGRAGNKNISCGSRRRKARQGKARIDPSIRPSTERRRRRRHLLPLIWGFLHDKSDYAAERGTKNGCWYCVASKCTSIIAKHRIVFCSFVVHMYDSVAFAYHVCLQNQAAFCRLWKRCAAHLHCKQDRVYLARELQMKRKKVSDSFSAVPFFISVGTTRGQGMIRDVVVTTFFWHAHKAEHVLDWTNLKWSMPWKHLSTRNLLSKFGFLIVFLRNVFTSVGTTRGQGIIRVAVVVLVVAKFFWHSHFLEEY